jgi:hypothetical protein
MSCSFCVSVISSLHFLIQFSHICWIPCCIACKIDYVIPIACVRVDLGFVKYLNIIDTDQIFTLTMALCAVPNQVSIILQWIDGEELHPPNVPVLGYRMPFSLAPPGLRFPCKRAPSDFSHALWVWSVITEDFPKEFFSTISSRSLPSRHPCNDSRRNPSS